MSAAIASIRVQCGISTKKKRNNCGLLILKRSIEERSQRTGTYSTCTQAQMC